MEFKSLVELVRIIENELAVQFYGRSTVLRKGVLKVLALVVGGALYLFSLVAKRVWKNRFVSTCDDSVLDSFGVEYGIQHKPEQRAEGSVIVSLASGTSSVSIPEGTLLVEPVTGLEFAVTAAATITSSSNVLNIQASEAGNDYNLSDGTPLEFKDDSFAGVSGMVSDSVYGGKSIEVVIDGEIQKWGETAADYRKRLLNRIQNPPHGGTMNDYWRWAMSFNPVTDAFVFPNTPDTNSVGIAVADFDNDIASAPLTVSSSKVTAIGDWIKDDSRRPITADVRVFSVTPVRIRIKASVVPYSLSVRENVVAAIKNFFRKLKPGSSVSFEQISVEVRANSTASTFTVTDVWTKSGNSWNKLLLPSLPMALDVENDLAQMAYFEDANIELVNGET